MKFYDLFIQSSMSGGESSLEKIADFAEKLGYSGIAICDTFQGLDKLAELKEAISKLKTGVEVFHGVNIVAENVNQMKEAVNKVREKVDIVCVNGGDYSINRSACDDSRIDVLMHPEMGRADSGLDGPCLQAATMNNIAIGMSFREALLNFRKPRAYILGHMAKNMMLCDHYKTQYVVCSCAHGVWEMRNPRELVSFASSLGADISKAFASVTSTPQSIAEGNRKTIDGTKITEGVEIVE
jgi:ribonuclease P/MRP protein subunit RPP1